MKKNRYHIPKSLPLFVPKSKQILEVIKQYDLEGLQQLMKINSKLAHQCMECFANMKFDLQGICALDAYDGLQFKNMKLQDLDKEGWDYLQEHLRILSGFYGMTRPMDSIYPYRLEMQTPLQVDGCSQLYAFWMDRMAKELIESRKTHKEPYIINLTSKEYDRSLRPYIMDDTLIDIVFYVCVEHQLITRATQAKMARGKMVRFMADHKIEHREDLKLFHEDGYVYRPDLSHETRMVFVKEGEWK